MLTCRVTEPDQWCQRCGCEGIPRDSSPCDVTVVICNYGHDGVSFSQADVVTGAGPGESQYEECL